MGRKESPVWAHVERLSAGKNPRVKCLQTGCGHVFTGNATRIEAHFMGEGSDVKKCSDPPQDLVEILTGARQEKQRQEAEKRQREQDAKEAEEAASTAKAARAAQGTDAAAAVRSNQASSSRAANTQIGRAFARGNRAVADEKLMDLIIKRGLPLSVGEGSELQEFVDAVQKCPGYKVPSRPTISGRLLDEAVMRTDASMAPFHTCTQKYGCGVVLDGWRDNSGNPLVNRIEVNAKGARFQSAKNTSGNRKSAPYICEVAAEGVEAAGPDNVTVVITDSAEEAAGRLLEAKYPKITWLRCTAHAADLAFEDAFKLEWLKDVMVAGKEIVSFINNHSASRSAWKALDGVLVLVRPGETRFATNYIMIERLASQWGKLDQLVATDAWKEMVRHMKGDDKAKADRIRDLVRDEDMEQRMQTVVSAFEELYKFMRMVDGQHAVMGKVFSRAFHVLEALRASTLPDDVRSEVVEIWQRRWDWFHSPLHGAGHCLDPEFWDDDGLQEGDVSFSDMLKMMEKMYPGEENKERRAKMRSQYASFRARENDFSTAEAAEDAPELPSWQWWDSHGRRVRELQDFARRVLSLVSSSSACERLWSVYGFIKSARRNRLTAERADKLVYCYANMRLAGRISGEEPFEDWADMD